MLRLACTLLLLLAAARPALSQPRALSRMRIEQASTPQELVGLVRSRARVIEVTAHLDLTWTPTNGLPRIWQLPTASEVAIYGSCNATPPAQVTLPDGFNYPGACYLYFGHDVGTSTPYIEASASADSRWLLSNLVLYSNGGIGSGIAFSAMMGSFFFAQVAFSGFSGPAIQLTDFDRFQLTGSAVENCGSASGAAIVLTTTAGKPSGQPTTVMLVSDAIDATYYSGGLVQYSPAFPNSTTVLANIATSVVPTTATATCSSATLLCVTMLAPPAALYADEADLYGLPAGVATSDVAPLSALTWAQVAPENDTGNWLMTLIGAGVPGAATAFDPLNLAAGQPASATPGGATTPSPTVPTSVTESGAPVGAPPASAALRLGGLWAAAVAAALALWLSATA